MPIGEKTFESALRELEAAVQRLESGELPLEQALACFEEGVRAVSCCQELLNQAELRVEQLVRDSTGRAELAPFNRVDNESGD